MGALSLAEFTEIGTELITMSLGVDADTTADRPPTDSTMQARQPRTKPRANGASGRGEAVLAAPVRAGARWRSHRVPQRPLHDGWPL
jgi:hypothetical protein